MLINLSNHPVSVWSEDQISMGVKQFGQIMDIPFPNIPPADSKHLILRKASSYAKKCFRFLSDSKDKNNAVHIMGELTFTFAVVNLLKQNNVLCVASTTERIVIHGDNAKTSYFKFIKFREY